MEVLNVNSKNISLIDEKLKISLEKFNSFVQLCGEEYQRVAQVEVEISNETPYRSFKEEADTSELDQEIERIERELGEECSNNQKENLTDDEGKKISATINKLRSELEKIKQKRNILLETPISVLGKYIRSNPNDAPKIVLYIKNILAAGGNTSLLIVQVYAHEMMHAYFDYDISKPIKYVSFVEEPITEVGMLDLMERYNSLVPGIFNDALQNLKKKKSVVGCMHYGFGAYLFENELPYHYWIGIMHDGKYNALDQAKLELYKKPFAQGKYPSNEQQYAEWLEELLDKFSKYKDLSACESAISGIEDMGVEAPDEIKRRLDRCKAKEMRNGTSDGSDGPVSIYDYMKVNTPYSPMLQKCIEDTVQHLFNPANSYEDTSIPGLLLGRIQSGKTRAFIGVMALAFDKGLDACIVLTKADNGLVNQTKMRLEYEFEHFSDESNIHCQNIVAIYDVNQQTALSTLQLQYKNIFVLHKNQRLDKMKAILDSSFVGKKVLIIDDEADFVSRTFYSKNKTITGGVTGFRIDELSNNPNIDCYYLQVTATPYSLILQPNDVVEVSNGVMSCFRPRFTVLVPKHDKYIGGKEYFEDSINSASMYSHLFHPITDECFDYMLASNSDARITSNPETHRIFSGLREALMSYFVASAIRQIQEIKLTQKVYKSSMLIHCATQKGEHTHEQRLVNKIIDAWKVNFNNSTISTIKPLIQSAYDDIISSIDAGNSNGELSPSVYRPSIDEVQSKLEIIFLNSEYTVKCVNGDTTDDPNMYTKSGQLKQINLLNIFISGFKADRGITIENMISFVYGRRPQSGGAANTILQHMRQYGNRSKEDMAVTRFHTTDALHQQLSDIYYTDESLRDFFMKNVSPSIISVDYDSSCGYRLCSPTQVRMSDMYGFKPFGRIIATGGMQTKAGIADEIKKITSEISSIEPESKRPFLVPKNQVFDWIRRIKNTFEYNSSRYGNVGIQWDEEIMIGAIEKYCHSDGKIWCYYKPGQNRRRIDPSGFADDPEDGTTDTPTAKKYATDRPFLMLIGEKGERDSGWMGQPFIWPVLRLPVSASNCVFCHGVKGSMKGSSNLSVSFVDGTVISGQKIIDTMIECIKKIGPKNIEGLNIVYRKYNLIYSAGRKPKDFETIVSGQYYLRKGIGADLAEKFLREISEKLHLSLDIKNV